VFEPRSGKNKKSLNHEGHEEHEDKKSLNHEGHEEHEEKKNLNHEGHEEHEEKRNEDLIFLIFLILTTQLKWCEIHHGARRRQEVIFTFFALKPSCPSWKKAFALNLRALRVLRGK